MRMLYKYDNRVFRYIRKYILNNYLEYFSRFYYINREDIDKIAYKDDVIYVVYKSLRGLRICNRIIDSEWLLVRDVNIELVKDTDSSFINSEYNFKIK